MRFYLNGNEYFTRTETIKAERIYTKKGNQTLWCMFAALPSYPTEKDICEFVLERGGIVVPDESEPE